jgi:glutathione S-transferase
MRTLYTLPFSPWSERARWVLLHHQLSFREREHTPLIGELALRARARRWRGPVSVPLLVDGDEAIVDSLAIAEHLDRTGSGARLIPAERVEEIRSLNARVESIFLAGRAIAIDAILTHDDAAIAVMPPALRRLPRAASLARVGSRFVVRKYGVSFDDPPARIRVGLLEIRQALAGKAHVFDRFSYADIVCATALHFIDPIDDRYVCIPPAIRSNWANAELAREFADLVAWRNGLYQEHRPLAQA